MKTWWQKSDKKNSPGGQLDTHYHSLKDLLDTCRKSADFMRFQQNKHNFLCISYFKTLVSPEILHRDIFLYLQDKKFKTYEELKNTLPFENIMVTNEVSEIQKKLFAGFIIIQLHEDDTTVMLVNALTEEKRAISIPEQEYSVIGPKEAFVESLDININRIRKRLPIPELTFVEIIVGNLSKTRICVAYIDGVANEENVNTVIQRIKNIEYDEIVDASFVTQMISDNRNSPFPQLIDTERPDRTASVLAEGKIAILTDGSPSVLTGPTTLVEFFSAFEDYFLTWHIASAFRLIRLFSVMFSVLSTPLYVAILTYHYELIPQDLLNKLVASRSGIPFPPVMEAIILELTIELLREAGARLPTKVGQTIGIVGGIVIGTAAVDAGLTSNVLLIVVALAALSSFTTPVYQMSNTIRLIRFPFILFAQFLGLLGISVCFAFVLAHLLGLTSLGRPYIAPIYPLRIHDLKDALFRLPFSHQRLRPMQVRSQNPVRFKDKAKKKKKNPDIEE
ncbi:GerA spore germination protein [Bacillus sp. OV322]|uniref:spore germination protein n=1 Tax=Bacillus sp. OV322 TaxID=1882764 RepID=UPI0008EE2E03|nr:spore germination protein [Bacillus sp. OV322]SFC35773.1 GerA spore germination protein [Bacillus sp. OV322]